MASMSPFLGLFGRSLEVSARVGRVERCLNLPLVHIRGAKTLTATQSRKEATKKKRKKYPNYKLSDLKDGRQYTLCDAMQYV